MDSMEIWVSEPDSSDRIQKLSGVSYDDFHPAAFLRVGLKRH